MQLPSLMGYKYVNLNGRFVPLEPFEHFPFEKPQPPHLLKFDHASSLRHSKSWLRLDRANWTCFSFPCHELCNTLLSSFKTLCPPFQYAIKIKEIWQIWKIAAITNLNLNRKFLECLQNGWRGVYNSQETRSDMIVLSKRLIPKILHCTHLCVFLFIMVWIKL